jgi:hypothetical protein
VSGALAFGRWRALSESDVFQARFQIELLAKTTPEIDSVRASKKNVVE